MNKQELRELRRGINFDMASFAACIGIPKSTLQRYEDGTAAVPARIERAALELEHINATFMQRYEPGGEFDREINQQYPHGFLSEGFECA